MSNILITDAIPYTNAPAHIGHALEFVQTDVLARYYRQRGDQVILTHGADEHGSKIYKKATEAGVEPQQFVDELTDKFKQAHIQLNVQYDRFVRTSSPEHKKTASYVWQTLADKGLIYMGEYIGWYCSGCEEFVPENTAKANNYSCPIHKQEYEKISDESYFFKLSEFTEQIKSSIETGGFTIVPEGRKNEILSLLNEGLEDISVSRPKEKLPWGIPVPGDDTHTMYVWIDALSNYLTAIDYPDQTELELFWPATVQVIGKDILRFHAAIWPGMLLGLGLALPRNLFVHGFISSDGQKMSKTLGNVVDPFEVIEQYGTDALRYYLLRHIPSGDDGDFSWAKFEQAYNGELANDLGNLVQRLAAMITRYQGSSIGDVPEVGHDEKQYHEALEHFKFDRAIEHVWSLIQGINQYIEETKPWELAKKGETEHLQQVLASAVGSLLQVAVLLAPFLPETAENISKQFGGGVVDLQAPLFPKIYKHTPAPNRN